MEKNNRISGYFTTGVSSKTCPNIAGKKEPIIGHMVGNAFAVTVVYPTCTAVLSIVGNLSRDEKNLDTVSIASHQAEDINHKPVGRIIGHGYYIKIQG